MHDMSLYEKKIINDKEFPVQMFKNQINWTGLYCPSHWHEHIELHYVLKGQGTFYCNHRPLHMEEGSLVIINSNELHEGMSLTKDFEALVIIFEMASFSKEVANFNVIFQSLIAADGNIRRLMEDIYREEVMKQVGYKMAMRGKLFDLITYLLRNYVVESLSDRANIRRIQNLKRLNMVLRYIQENYTEAIKIQTLAEMIHLSEYRFCHLFKESLGQSPLNYINEVRLKKAHHLLEQQDMTVAEVAAAVGFTDYNNFGRLFRKYYGYAPSYLWA